ncbi:MAG: hypothetical protein ABF449_03960, partial [Ethanoligenens sp.]
GRLVGSAMCIRAQTKTIRFCFKKPLAVLAAAATLLVTQLPALADGTGVPVMTGYTVTTNHSSDLIQHSTDSNGNVIPMTDNQYMNIDVTFNKPIQATPDAASDLAITLSGSTSGSYINPAAPDDSSQNITDPFSKHVTATASGNILHIVFYYGFAQYMGGLTIKPAAANGTVTKITGTDGTPVQWSNISCLVPNGIKLSTVDQTPANPAAGVTASVTKQVINPQSATRGAVWYVFLKNGQPVGSFSPTSGSFAAHYHMYLTLDAKTYASYFPSGFKTKYGSQYTLTATGDTITVTSNKNADGTIADAAGDVLDVLVYAYPRDRDTGADKTGLSTAISKASAFGAANYTAASYAAVKKQLAIASSMNSSIYYLQPEIDAQVSTLNTAVSNLVTVAQQQAVDDFIASVATLPANVSLQDAAMVSGLADTYAKFTDAQKALVSSATLHTLQTAEDQIQTLENSVLNPVSSVPDNSSPSSSASSDVSSAVVSNPKTGESTSVFMPTAVLLAGAAIMLLTAGYKKRRG